MALASLCRDVTKRDSIMAPLFAMKGYPIVDTSFTAFIVNHKLRDNSDAEALLVTEELSKMGIDPKILELDWSSYGDPKALTNLESVARKLRYQALGIACRDAGITTLLLAHHVDDRAETVMLRILRNYLGAGLESMRPVANIPECAGIYGVDKSGSLHVSNKARSSPEGILSESGGIVVRRPLLSVRKENLIKLCTSGGVKWFEDHTNADRSMTLRNTIRFLERSDVLPASLRTPRLSKMASKVAQRNRTVEDAAAAIVRTTKVTLDFRAGTARIALLRSPSPNRDESLAMQSYILRELLNMVAPTDNIELPGLLSAVDFAFESTSKTRGNDKDISKQKRQVAGVSIQRNEPSESDDTNAQIFTLSRATPTAAEWKGLQLPLWSPPRTVRQSAAVEDRPDWRLWDGRYWISVSPPKTKHEYAEIVARFLSANDVATLRKSLPAREQRERLQKALNRAKGFVRYSLPVIVAKDSSGVEEIVALPSLNWSIPGWKRSSEPSMDSTWHWDIRYKRVALNTKGPHTIIH